MSRWVVWLLPALALVANDATAYEQRSGTFSAGIQAQVTGLLKGQDRLSVFEVNGLEGFGVGVNLGFRVNLDRKSALGISFGTMDFERTDSGIQGWEFGDEFAARDTASKVHGTIVTLDYYQYVRRKAKQTPHLVLGVGYYRPEIRFGEINTQFPGSNIAVKLGLGGEHFLSRSVSLEVSARVYGLNSDDGVMVSADFALGLRFYHLRGRRR